MNAGDAFLIENEHGIKHLHVIVSDPAQNPDSAYLVMISTFEERREDGCILNQGDHPRLHHQSVVVYQRPRLSSPRFPCFPNWWPTERSSHS